MKNYNIVVFSLLIYLGACNLSEKQETNIVDPLTPDIGATLGEAKFGKMMRGIPDVLLPESMSEKDIPMKERFSIVNTGKRDLKARPFDYRSPFTLETPDHNYYEIRSAKDGNGIWPIKDKKEAPFNYYFNDKVAIGRSGGPETAVVDAFGTLRAYTGAFGFAEKEGDVFNVRIRILEDGYLPIVKAETEKEGCEYNFEYFGCNISGAPLVSFPRSKQNFGKENVSGDNYFISMSCSITQLENSEAPLVIKLAYDEQALLPAGAHYSFPDYNKPWDKVYLNKAQNKVYRIIGERAGKAYTIALVNTPMELLQTNTRLTHWPLVGNPTKPEKTSKNVPKNPKYLTLNATKSLKANEKAEISLLIPVFPLEKSDDAFLMSQNIADLKSETKESWQNRRADFFGLSVPEDKVENTFYTAINNLDICMVSNGKYKYPTPGPSGGHHIFYGRDAGDMIYAYDLMGDHKTAEEMLNIFHTKGGGREAGSIYIWAMERHFAMTRDTVWLKNNFNIIEKLMNSFLDVWETQKDPETGVFKARKLHDNEYIVDSYVGTHIYLASSAKRAVRCAEALGNKELAGKWQDFHTDFSTSVRKALEKTCEGTGGVITPGFAGYDAPSYDTINMPFAHYGKGGGCDWHNLGALYPTNFLQPNDPLNKSSYNRWRHCYVEGIFPYARRQGNYSHLHNYNVLNLSESFLRDGMYAEALRDLYGVLLHTAATHSAAEQIFSRGRLDHGTTPHNWFSGKIISFIRDMLVYEDENTGELNLLAGMSPEWMKPGEKIELKDAPTTLGKISMTAEMSKNAMELEIDFDAYKDGKGMVLNIPPFVSVNDVFIEGKSIKPFAPYRYRIPLETKNLTVKWAGYPWPNISYKEVVNSYVRDYEQRVAWYKQTVNTRN